MSYQQYTIEDFLHDPHFRKWVLNPDPDINFFWEKWLLNHPDRKKDIQTARKLVQTLHIKDPYWNKERKSKLWDKITETNNRILQADKNSNKNESKVIQLPESHSNPVASRNLFWPVFSKVAAVFVILLTGTYLWQKNDKKPDEELPLVPALVEKFNPKGQKSKIFLPDGSIVYLNSNSKLTYPEKFTKGVRIVELSGEAFFEVEKDTLHPFSVRTANAITTALGTSFNVKAYKRSKKVKIALLTGQVKIEVPESKKRVVLNPGQLATIDKENQNLSTNNFNYLETIAWKEGILYFNEMELNKAFRKLEQWYGVSFEFNSSPDESILVTGTFDNEYLSNVLKSLSYTVSFNYSINGNEVKIKFDY